MRVPAAPPFVPEAVAQEGLASVSQVRSAGLSDRRLGTLVAHRVWTRPARGVYDTTPAAPRPLSALRRRAAWLALLAYGPEAIAVGSCALALHGIEGLPMTIRPEAALPDADRREPRSTLRLRRFDDGGGLA
ncbi:type IV toxin-antitoxin system AbiEi family antitoxin domain-containing protein [Luteimicrobium subarcticum]|uniref:Uncharacterized protein n=1 Tax=Luteimicrobium subarcticum TaxID=620910 RepID=A0A2M8WRY6_9MICO|nr:type IV toxin-antitoxin system AbiEi family antitoxin domain-containing protein [Luteimicrobium subarcticum]PJI93701.1 hypothetical protein CLV34_1175 [Luteimicrobium subarcticum]